MPRKRPGALRAARQTAGPYPLRDWAQLGARIDRLSPETTATIHAIEERGYLAGHTYPAGRYDPDPFREHLRPGRTAEGLRQYRRFLSRPGNRLRLESSLHPSCPGCQYDDLAVTRDALEAITRLLPLPARTELRRLLTHLDDAFHRRTLPESLPRAHWSGEPLPWWHRRVYRD